MDKVFILAGLGLVVGIAAFQTKHHKSIDSSTQLSSETRPEHKIHKIEKTGEPKPKETPDFSTICARHQHIHPRATSAMSLPIVSSSTYELDSVEHGANISARPDRPFVDSQGFVYTRWHNPTVQVAAEIICAMENAKGTLLFGSGMAAITNTLLTLVAPGDHIVIQRAVYGGAFDFVSNILKRFGVTHTMVDGHDSAMWSAAVQPNTKVFYAETPCNPLVRITDLSALGELSLSTSRRLNKKTYVVVDATFASPYHCRALEIPGVDISLHSATKYMGGHSDLTAGAVSSKDEKFLSELGGVSKITGGILSAFEAALLCRGLKTLDVRMQRHNENAMAIAQFLQSHPRVEVVHYPGLHSHPDHALAKRQMRNGFGAMIAFEVKGGLEAGKAVVSHLRLINLAVSLGSVESLIIHPPSTTHEALGKEARQRAGINDGLIRFSVGIESAADLIRDLEQALAVVKEV
jgi:methionine-gamma-lyase